MFSGSTVAIVVVAMAVIIALIVLFNSTEGEKDERCRAKGGHLVQFYASHCFSDDGRLIELN